MMSVTLLALCRQYAAGKISKEHYRSQRRALLEEQVFLRDEQTVPALQSANDYLEDQTAERTLPHVEHYDSTLANDTSSHLDTTTISQKNNFSRPAPSVNPEPRKVKALREKPNASVFIKISIIAAIVVITAFAGFWLITVKNIETTKPGIEPLVQQTQLLLENPDWKVVDIQGYRKLLASQETSMKTEQTELLASVNLYLSVPANGEDSELDAEVLALRSDLEALSRRDR